jgi:hypothetical protein
LLIVTHQPTAIIFCLSTDYPTNFPNDSFPSAQQSVSNLFPSGSLPEPLILSLLEYAGELANKKPSRSKPYFQFSVTAELIFWASSGGESRQDEEDEKAQKGGYTGV